MTVPDPVPPRSDCRVVTYNVLYEGVAPDGHGWAHRQEAVTAELDRLGPDAIAFQEVWMDQFADLQEDLSGYSWVAATDTPAHTPIAYRTDRFEAGAAGTFWLSEPEAEPGVPGWDATYQRLVTYAVLSESAGDRTLAVMNVHLDHEGKRARIEGATLARDRLTSLDADGFVLAGDFNCRPGTTACRRVTGDGDGVSLSDAGTVAEETGGPTATYTGFAEQTYESQRIDHIFVSSEIGVDRRLTCVPPTEPDLLPSDHRPVLADLSY